MPQISQTSFLVVEVPEVLALSSSVQTLALRPTRSGPHLVHGRLNTPVGCSLGRHPLPPHNEQLETSLSGEATIARCIEFTGECGPDNLVAVTTVAGQRSQFLIHN